MAGRTPLEVGVLGPGRRREVLGQELGLLVLQELQRQARRPAGPRSGPARPWCPPTVRKLFMKISGSAGVVLLAQVEHLPGDDVEEGQPAAHAQQRLGAVHAHRRAEPAVELDHGGGRDRLRGGLVGSTSTSASDSMSSGLDRGLGDHAGLAVLEQPVVVGEDLDRDRVDPGGGHLVACLVQGLCYPYLDRRLVRASSRARTPEPRRHVRGRQARAARPAAHRAQPARSLVELGEAGGRDRRRTCWRTRRYAGRPPSRRTSRSGTEPGTGLLLDALRRAGKRVHPAGAAARPRPRLGGATRAGSLAPRAARAARAGRAPAGRRRGRHAPTWCWCRAWPSSPTASGSAAAAAPTTGRSAGCRSAPSPACCSTTTRSAATCPPSRTTGRCAPRPPLGITRF